MNLHEYLKERALHVEYPLAHKYDAVMLHFGMVVKINNPIVTLEADVPIGDCVPIYGISYCRPDDDWNPIVGVKKAVDSAIARGFIKPEHKALWWRQFEPHRNRILKHWNYWKMWCSILAEVDAAEEEEDE